ncbi:phosphatase [Heyndrickxia shackletonii]|uniref:Phosphatase n=1 Tax=Heyndrickxia shackletonii TaxID=157838 RepID=A0A0Q3T8P9_9BACI|nr:HAD family hydrolase [Heyndrickxia shackletonii]KQL50350.1 phosphatase [Heyndrickxia shackletonii]NEZ01639.1 HAD family hydrolase [Heyndrickxia shackletonii]
MVQTILFDVDGVLLSEERYFDASALTVWELLYSENYLGIAPEKFKTSYSDEEIASIRKQVFEEADQVLKFFKSRGLNANWDMIYIAFSYQLIHLLSQIKDQEHSQIVNWFKNEMDRKTLLEIKDVLKRYKLEIDFSKLLEDFKKFPQAKRELFIVLDKLAEEKLRVQSEIFKQKGSLWSICEHCSQEWYVGDKNILASTGRASVQTGKKGFLDDEKVLAKPEEIADLFQFLRESGISIGIGTGRPELETIEPFAALGWLDQFDVQHIVTADDVLKAENTRGSGISLSKPHPFTYLMALKGKGAKVDEILNQKLPIEYGNEVLVVGDSLADLLAAQKMGCRFAAVLTGLSGKDARTEFEEHNAEFILDSVLDIKKLITSICK